MLVVYFGSFRPTKKHIEDVLGKVQPFPATKPPTVHPRPTSPATWASCVRWARRSASLGAPRWCQTGLRWERGGVPGWWWNCVFEWRCEKYFLRHWSIFEYEMNWKGWEWWNWRGNETHVVQAGEVEVMLAEWWCWKIWDHHDGLIMYLLFGVANSHVKGLNWYIISSYHHAPVRIAILWLQHCDAKDTQPQCGGQNRLSIMKKSQRKLLWAWSNYFFNHLKT